MSKKQQDVTLKEFLGEIGHGYTLHRINTCEWRIDGPGSELMVSGGAGELATWVLHRLRHHSQICVIREAVAVFDNSSRPLEQLHVAVERLQMLGVDTWDSVPKTASRK